MFKGLKSLFTGIVAGTALGILFSPKKGEEIRKNFKNELKKGGSGLKTLKDTVTEMGEELEETAVEAYKNVTKSPAYKKGKAKAKKTVKKVVAEGKKVVAEGKKALEKGEKAIKKGKKTVKKTVKKAVKKAKK